jgi:hypothetical protein
MRDGQLPRGSERHLSAAAAALSGEEGGEMVEHAGIHCARDDRAELRVAVRAGRRRDAVRGDPRRRGLVGLGLAEQLAERQVQLDLGRLSGSVRQPARGATVASAATGPSCASPSVVYMPGRLLPQSALKGFSNL